METAKNRNIKIAFIGMGLMGQERLSAVKRLFTAGKHVDVAGVYDPYCKNKKEIQDKFKVVFYDSISELYDLQPDWLFIAVPHNLAVDFVKQSLKKGFNVFVEKPLGRSAEEARMLLDSAIRSDQLWVGFNYRFFDGISMALEDIRKNKFGRLVSVNMILGHGCYPKIKETWKLDSEKAGGGCLIDPGIHLLDLCRIITNGTLKVKAGLKWEGFWKTGIEEECHFLFEAESFLLNVQISIVRWRSSFKIEINGEQGYGVVSGRGRSYGNQTYISGARWGWMNSCSQKDSEKLILETSGDDVFVKEIHALLFSSGKNSIKPCSAQEAVRNMQILEECRKVLR